MKILLANKFYYPKGGDCTYTFNLEQLLRKNGHDVAIFAMDHSNNLQSEWSEYFPSEVSYTSDKPGNKVKSVIRPLGADDVKKNFIRLLKDFKPDIVHLNNIHTHLSPVIAKTAYEEKIKVIWTLHDYKLLCPRSDCLRHDQFICEKCFHSKINVIKYRCTKNNLFASILAYFEALEWNCKKLDNYTTRFICPSNFMKKKMIQGGFQEKKLIVLHNFIDTKKVERNNYKKSDYYCYLGRISVEKGVETLLKAARMLPYPLKIIGSGPLSADLQSRYQQDHIHFLGQKNWDEIKTILENARFSVLPSECYENNPFAIIESLCLGTPVIGASIGGITELIKENQNGLLFKSRDVNDLKDKIALLYNAPSSKYDYQSIAENSCNSFSASSYYESLKKIYEETY